MPARIMPTACYSCRIPAGASPGPTGGESRAGLKLTGHFLLERVLEPHGREMPQAARLRAATRWSA